MGVQPRGPPALTRGFRPCGKDTRDLLLIAAHDRGVDAVAGDRRILRQDALGGAVVHAVIAFAMHIMIPACRLQEGDDALGAFTVARCSGGGAALGEDSNGVRLALRRGPLERRAVGRRPPLAIS